jgi:tetratricopeptide (TPR) repeat protein
MTQEDLANRAQVAVRTVRNVEAGRSPVPRAHTKALIERALRLPPAGVGYDGDDRQPLHRRAPVQLPAEVADFIGRTDELAALDRLLDAEAVSPTCVISGMPGVGKTALAVRWANAARSCFPDGQLYINLRGFDGAAVRRDPADVLRGFLEALGVEGQRPETPDLVGLFRSVVADRRLLVLLDDAYDAEQVRPLLPSGGRSVTVVTSRDQLPGLVAVDAARPLVLQPCRRDEARAMVTARVGAERAEQEPAAVDRIIDRCGRLPLALAVVSARAALNPRFSLAALVHELDTDVALEVLDGGEPASDLASVFSWSYRRLSGPAARLLRVIGQLPRTGIALESAASAMGWTRRATRVATSELCRTNLLVEHAPGRFVVHELLHAYARSRAAELDSPDERKQVQARIRDHYVRTAQDAAALLRPHRRPTAEIPPLPGVTPVRLADDGQALAWFDVERSTLRALLHSAASEQTHEAAGRLARAMAPFLERRALWTELGSVGRIANDAARALDDVVGQQDALSILGRAHLRRGDHDGARVCLAEALRLATERGDTAEIAAAHFDLAVLEDTTGNPAASLCEVTLARNHYRAADDEAGEAFALNAMGWDHLQLGQPEQAMAYCQEAIALYRKHGSRHGEAATWDTLGLAQHTIGHHDRAVESFREGLALVGDTGDRHLEALLLDRLGNTLTAQGDRQAARQAWRRVLRVVDASDERGVEWTAPLRAMVNTKLATTDDR